MRIAIDLNATINKKEDIDALYCALHTRFPDLFNNLKEEEFSVRLKHLHVKWSGNINCTGVRVKPFSDVLKQIFDYSKLRKCRYYILIDKKKYLF